MFLYVMHMSECCTYYESHAACIITNFCVTIMMRYDYHMKKKWCRKKANLMNGLPFANVLLPFIISFSYTCSSFTNIIPSNWFRLAHLSIFYPTKIFPHIVFLMVSTISKLATSIFLSSSYHLCNSNSYVHVCNCTY